MDSTFVTLLFSALANIALASFLAVRFRRRVKNHVVTEAKAKTTYSLLCVGLCIFSSVAVFLGASLFNLPVGVHGQVLIIAPLLNLLLAGVLIIAGSIVIGWVPIEW